MADINDDQIIETMTEDGEVVQFRLFDIIEFEEKEYALLLPVETEDGDDEDEIVLMRLTKEDDDYLFETIDDDDEFDRVSEYIESIDDEE